MLNDIFLILFKNFFVEENSFSLKLFFIIFSFKFDSITWIRIQIEPKTLDPNPNLNVFGSTTLVSPNFCCWYTYVFL